MHKLLFFIPLFILQTVLAQPMSEIDSLSYEICDYVKELVKVETDSATVSKVYQEKLVPYLKSLPPESANKASDRLFFRLQRNCHEFSEVLDRLDPPKTDFKRKKEKPITAATKDEIKAFKNQKEFKYFEVNGAQTNVEIKDGIWTDRFADGTYSRLELKWIGETEFELTFLESNNTTRSNFSYKGDKIIYDVVDREDGFFLLSANIPGQKVYLELKLYDKTK